nr:glycosyltransferase family 2 protein [Bacteroidales bacterium]
IIPCYNQAIFLSETLDSVMAQKYQNWECIIVNDGSPDNTEDISLDYCKRDLRFKYYKKKNEGLSVARNFGIKKSSGYYILPLDSDDLIGDTYLEKAIDVFISQPDTKVVYCNANKFGDINEKWDLPKYSFDKLLWSNLIFCAAFFKRIDYDKTIGYNPNMIYGFEDWDFWLSLLNPDDKVVQLDDTLFFYRQHNDSMIHNTDSKQKILLSQLVKNHLELYYPFVDQLIILKNKQNQLELAYKQINDLLSTKEFRIGKMFTKRFELLSKIIIKIGDFRKHNNIIQ